MELLSQLAINPLRIAFDDIKFEQLYIEKIHLAHKYRIKRLSNYILFNYKDSPDDFYNRLETNIKLNEELGLSIFSFPMKFVPLDAKDRKYVGPKWTKTQLNDAAFNFLRELPLVVQGDNFICTHADLSAPAGYHYVFQPLEATSCWEACLEQLIFIGHTHIPGVHMIGEMGVPHWLPPQELRCNKAMRYIINVGSVGQPRDGDLRACYCIYHTDKETISFHRVSFDVKTHITRLREKHLPIHPSMLDGQVSNPGEWLRNMEFHPLGTLEEGRPPAPGQTRAETVVAQVDRAGHRGRSHRPGLRLVAQSRGQPTFSANDFGTRGSGARGHRR